MTVAVPLRPSSADSPQVGGTLRLCGPADVDRLDPAVASEAPATSVVRLFSRQLVTYEPRADLRDWQAIAPVPDVAVHVPSTYNAGLGASHRCYVVHLRPGVLWDSAPPRPVTAHDFVRGFKRIGNPVTRSPAVSYFTSTIRGMADFCAGFAAAVSGAEPTAAALAAYHDAHDIPGVFALDDETLVIELVRPAPEFVNVLALTCASAAPAEYDAFVPGSPELQRNLRSNGPYRIVRAVRGRALELERNPAWRPESDPVRAAYVDRVEITRDDVGPRELAARIQAGHADLPWTAPLPPRGGPDAPRGATLSHALDPYLVFNLIDGAVALCDVRVRRAVAAAVGRAALADRLGSGAGLRVADRIVPPGNDPAGGGDHSDTPDRDRALSLLAEAGYGDGLTLTAVYRDRDSEPEVARAYAADLERVGIAVHLVALDDDEYRSAVLEPTTRGPRGWDLTTRSRSADWLHRNGRAFLQPLFETGGTANYGGYSNPMVDQLITRALEAAVEPQAELDAAWRDVERRVLDDLAVVPLLFRAPAVPAPRGRRVRGACPVPASGYADDLAAVWLDGAGEEA